MLRIHLLPAVYMLFLLVSLSADKQFNADERPQRQVISCGPGGGLTLEELPRIKHPRLIYPDAPSNLPQVMANDNREPAGQMKDNVLELNLEVVWSDFYFESNGRPGLRMATIAERGKAPTVPAPMIRVETGTKIHVVVHNTLTDSTVTVYGLQQRPAHCTDILIVEPGETKEITFESGEAGTYMYWMKLCSRVAFDVNEEQQLAGAFIIDPKGGSPADRVFVVNVFGTLIDTALFANGYLEALTINGRSYPFTERITPAVGDTLRWRIVNASQRIHPMHLHGFNFKELSLGGVLRDSIFKSGYQPSIVTQNMPPQTTMSMQWVASRPGNWLFHCHLSFHVTPEVRLPGSAALDPPGQEAHMAGLVLGIYVKPGTSDLKSQGPSRSINLYANEYQPGKWKRNGFSFIREFKADTNTRSTPGPLLLLKQYQSTYVTVTNNMSVPTSVHWHGLDLDSWADGVPEFSASDGMVSPSIKPGNKFTYKLTLMRPGTYIYHSHLNDKDQIASGLYGPIIVLKPNEIYNPKLDHYYVAAWKTINPQSMQDVELNGSFAQPDMQAHVGEKHRIRFIHIAPAGDVKVTLLKDGKPVEIKFIAKDGTDMPVQQQRLLKESEFFGVGETADFEFKPMKAGTYTLQFVMVEGVFFWSQQWIVKG